MKNENPAYDSSGSSILNEPVEIAIARLRGYGGSIERAHEAALVCEKSTIFRTCDREKIIRVREALSTMLQRSARKAS